MADNKNYQELKDFFMQRFPDATEEILQMVAENRLIGLEIDEKLEKISSATAEALISFFKTLSPGELESLLINAIQAQIRKKAV